MNIFISFSGVSREEFALAFLNFFNKYGFSCWYDQHELFLGDELKQTIIKKGIETSDYCILIINKTYLNRNWPCEEAKKLYKKLEARKNFAIFPILLDITKEDVRNTDLNFLLSIKYQFLHSGESIDKIGLQILNRIFHDLVSSNSKFKRFDDAVHYFKRLTLSNSIAIYNSLHIVNSFDATNYKERSIILISLINLFNNNPYEKALKRISYAIYDNASVSFDMYKIVESIFLISASIFVD